MLSSYAVPANEGCSGTSGTKTLTLAAAGSFANDDLILIHQTRGTGAGTWQLNKIVSGATTTTLTLKYDLTNTYIDSGASQAQVIEMNQYEDMTTGAITAPDWDGSKGGILAWFDKGTTTVGGAISLSEKGFRLGAYPGTNQRAAFAGEGTVGGSVRQTSANGNGGGGGSSNNDSVGESGGGAGGGNATAGQNGDQSGSSTRGIGGLLAGNSALTSCVFGGGSGGGSALYSDGGGANGKIGGGIAFIFAKDIVTTGSVISKGGDGQSVNNGYFGSSGGGAGGSILLKCETATLGTNLITAPAGARSEGGSGSSDGGAGSVGRIHIDYSKSFTGTTSPTIDSTLDTTITAGGGSNMFMWL